MKLTMHLIFVILCCLNVLLADNLQKNISRSHFKSILEPISCQVDLGGISDEAKSTDQENFNVSANLSFVIIDLKFNDQDGVKICEMQPGSKSVFTGYDYLVGGDGLVADMFCKYLSQFQKDVWFLKGDISDRKLKQKFIENRWHGFRSLKALIGDLKFGSKSHLEVADPFNLNDYHGILFSRFSSFKSLDEFKIQNPGILLIDAAYFPYFKDKHVMDQLLTSKPKLKKLRPKSKLYLKGESESLAKLILQDFNSELLVIKPTDSTLGQGVIILERHEIEAVLDYIFNKNNIETLLKDHDNSFYFWARDKNKQFLIEEFIPSDPVSAPQFGNQLYDGTMRVVAMLVFDQRKFEVVILEGHWKLPKNSISDSGTLNEKHKSYGKERNFAFVDSNIMEKVRAQLQEGLEELYAPR